MGLQDRAVVLDAVEHRGRDRNDHARRSEFSFRENVMDETAMHAPVAVLERVHIDKAEGGDSRMQYRVDTIIAHAIIRLEQAVHEVLQVGGPGTDEFRPWIAVVVSFAEEDAVKSQSRPNESRVLDQDALQAGDFLDRQPVLAGLQDRTAPPLQPAARRTLALDLEAGPAVGEQHETGSARNEMGARAPDDVARPGGEIELHELRERLGAPDHRTESDRAQEIVPHAVPFRQARPARDVRFGIEKIDRLRARRILHVERSARERLV